MEVKLAASIPPSRSAIRHSSEFAAKASMASDVSVIRRAGCTVLTYRPVKAGLNSLLYE
jgi:hypothetical protein